MRLYRQHPAHAVLTEVRAGYMVPIKPIVPGWWNQVMRRPSCVRSGGHYWHPDRDSMVGWYCCQCGAEADGSPEDGKPTGLLDCLFL